jgi:hypothetical protein
MNARLIVTAIAAAVILHAAIKTMFGADIIPVDQRLAYQLAGLSLQIANLGHDLDMCKASLAEVRK